MVIDPEAFQRNFRKILKQKNMTQKQFAAESGLTYRSVGLWCNGVLPTADNLACIAKALNVSADKLLEGIVK